MTRGTKNLSRQADRRTSWTKTCATRPRQRRARASATFSVADQAQNLPKVLDLLRQILREPTLARGRIRGVAAARPGPARTTTDRSASAGHHALAPRVSPYEKDDVRYVPTVKEDIERHQVGYARATEGALCGLSRLASRASWRWSATSIRNSAGPRGRHFRRLDLGKRVRAAAQEVLSGRERGRRRDPDARQGQRHVLRRPDVPHERLRIPIIRRCRRAITFWAPAHCPRGWAIAFARKKGFPTGSARRLPQTRSMSEPV